MATLTIGERPNPPQGWREGHNLALACPHRNQSVCQDCSRENTEAWDCAGEFWWVPLSQRPDTSNDAPARIR